MSGGVDSSVAAALLVEAGHEVTGVTMRLLDEDDAGGRCPPEAARDAQAVCDLLGIPHYTLDLREDFARAVVGFVCEQYASGRTPNPCIACNDRVKFGVLLERVLAMGADMLATGHYARVVTGADGAPWLARGADVAKDQSYFLYRLSEQQLGYVAFPVGELTKTRVRELARERALPVAERHESQDVCFAPDGLGDFIADRMPGSAVPGDVVDPSGRVIGSHRGIASVTIGQRKGLRILDGQRRFVSEVRPADNVVVAGPRESLLIAEVVASDPVWRGGPGPVRVSARLRSRSAETSAEAWLSGDELHVRFDEPLEGSAPGQAVVCWAGDIVVGGGVIRGAL
jgi:tRNA-uridine 2-sulfurtransferase